jgi:hypothetical protein
MDGSQANMEISLPDLASYTLYATATDSRNNTGTSATYTTTITEQPLIEKRDFQLALMIVAIVISILIAGGAYAIRRAKKGFVKKR